MKHFALFFAVLLALPGGGCMMKPRHMEYPQGVTLEGWHVPNFEVCIWNRDPDAPLPCPLVIHLPAGDLGDKELSDTAALKRAGWEEQDNGTLLLLRGASAQVSCKYRGGALVGVSVSALPSSGGGPGVVSVAGKQVSLPATDE